MTAPSIFISYSHKDEKWKERIVKHLGVSQEQGLLSLWDDRRIDAGEDWYEAITEAMDAGSVAVILLTANSLTSKFILREEVPRLLERRDEAGLRIFPIVVEPCDWEAVEWVRRMQLRPKDGKPLSGGRKHQVETNLAAIAKEIRLMLTPEGESADGESRAESAPTKGSRSTGIAKISLGRLPVTGSDLFGRDEHLRRLDEAWANRDAHVLSFVAWGGVGKSALVNHWLARMARDEYRGAERVYGWSFYSQGTTDRAVSADQFIEAALIFFGDANPNLGSPWEKGERLAGLVGKRRTLLVLDGLEPLQFPPGPDEGRLKEQSMQALLRGLAAHNSGLCVISTRVRIADLADYEDGTVTRVELENLSPEAGAKVLVAQGVSGTQAELEQASREFGGHSLALTLLGSYLSDVYGGDITRRNEVRGLEDDERHGRHAQRVMTSYERWFGEGPELSVLRTLGLFNRPANKGSIDALRAAPAISGLTDTLQGMSEPAWQRTLSKLRRAKLLAARDDAQPDTLDAHPLVREHFGTQLKGTKPDAWREGNSRLYEHLRNTANALPDTIEEMTPLYAAVTHGCAAGRHQEVFSEVYWPRILRGNEFFNTRKLSAFGINLAILIDFFDIPWRQPVQALNDDDRAFILNEAGYVLRVLGLLGEATQPIRASLQFQITHEGWVNASISTVTLVELYLLIGDITQALSYARQGVEFADNGNYRFRSVDTRSALAEALLQAGNLSEAETVMREAYEMQKVGQPNFPLLYSIPGFRYCSLLLHQGKYQEVQAHALQTLAWMTANKFPLYIALDNLSLGRAFLLQARRESTNEFLQAREHLNRAVTGLRETGYLDYLSDGLLARAELRRAEELLYEARVDLDEAMSISTRGGMGLHRADCHLEYARLYLAGEPRELGKAREHLERAREMIERMGYHLRDGAVRELEEELEAAGG